MATDGTRVIVGAPCENGVVLDADGFALNGRESAARGARRVAFTRCV